MALALFNRAKQMFRRMFGTGADIPKPTYKDTSTPYYSAEMKRQDRHNARTKHLVVRSMMCWAKGGPKLKGKRLARLTDQCSERHLTVLCKGRITSNGPQQTASA